MSSIEVASVVIPAMVLTIIASIILLDVFTKKYRIIHDYIPAWAVLPTMGVVVALDYIYTGDFIP